MERKKRVAVLAGGFSGERAISLKSAAMVMNNIDKERFAPYLVQIGDDWTVEDSDKVYRIDKNAFTYTTYEGTQNFDLVFMMIHGSPGENGLLQGYFETIGMPVSTGDAQNMSFTFHKYMCNIFLRAEGFNTAQAILLYEGQDFSAGKIVEKLGLPCFVKPNAGGSSLGNSIVKSEEDLAPALEKAFQVDNKVLIESFVSGREFTCGVIPINGTATALPVTEIISENEYFDYEAKYEGKNSEITPANLEEKYYSEIQRISPMVYNILNCKGMARVDFLMQDGAIYIIEINTVPGFSEMSILPQQAEQMGVSKKELISLVIDSI